MVRSELQSERSLVGVRQVFGAVVSISTTTGRFYSVCGAFPAVVVFTPDEVHHWMISSPRDAPVLTSWTGDVAVPSPIPTPTPLPPPTPAPIDTSPRFHCAVRSPDGAFLAVAEGVHGPGGAIQANDGDAASYCSYWESQGFTVWTRRPWTPTAMGMPVIGTRSAVVAMTPGSS
jgi:hypothetical protein